MAPVYEYKTPIVYVSKPILQASPQPQSLILNLPWEIRSRILHLAIPSNVNLIYDAEFLLVNDPIKKPDCEAAVPLLLTSRQVYHEVATVFYACNILTFMKPLLVEDCRNNLSQEAIRGFRKVEVCLYAELAEMGRIWHVLSESFPSVTELTLNMIRAGNIAGPLGEVMWRSQVEKQFTVTLELHDTEFRSGAPADLRSNGFRRMLYSGADRAGMYDLKKVPNLKKINVKVSLRKEYGDVFAEYRCPDADFAHLHFSKDGDRDTPETKYLIWKGRE